MAVQILLQPAHGYVPLLVVLMAFVNLWASVKVGEARRKYNILYPQVRRMTRAMDTDADTFVISARDLE